MSKTTVVKILGGLADVEVYTYKAAKEQTAYVQLARHLGINVAAGGFLVNTEYIYTLLSSVVTITFADDNAYIGSEEDKDEWLLARDTLRDFWSNRGSDLASDLKAYGELHHLATDSLFNCIIDARKKVTDKLPEGNPSLTTEKKTK